MKLVNQTKYMSIIALVFSLLLRHVLSACSDDEWDCDDGSCIPLDARCNGTVDCADGSDEIAENCIHLYRSCPKFGFACSNGACIPMIHKCNGIQDCADNSDELGCRKTCGQEEMQCLQSKECIDKDYICDGFNDCSDGSDETLEVCATFQCPGMGFHCGYGGCIDHAAMCNGTMECSDGSDEAWVLCGTPRKTSKTKTTPTPAAAGCEIPSDIANVTVKLHPQNDTIALGGWVEDSETIHVECSNRTAIRGSASLLCDNGKFNSEFPFCSTYCDGNLLKGISTVYYCFRNGRFRHQSLCGKRILPNTEILVTCAVGYKRSKGKDAQKIQCLPNGMFDVTREPCNPDCGIVQPSIEVLTRRGKRVKPNEVPWHVAIYELSQGNYSFICGGSVISPTLIISAAHCFSDEMGLVQTPVENYQFIAGKYTRNYSKTGDEMPQIRKAVSIEISESFHGKRDHNYADVALIKLKEPLIYNDNISAVCISISEEGSALDYVNTGKYGTVTGYGQKNTLEQVGMTTIDFYTCSTDVMGLTSDKFCMSNKNDMSVCRGDSGGGFVVKDGGKFYIWGIISYAVSTTQDCARDGFVSATNVRYIKPKLRKTIQSVMTEDNLLY